MVLPVDYGLRYPDPVQEILRWFFSCLVVAWGNDRDSVDLWFEFFLCTTGLAKVMAKYCEHELKFLLLRKPARFRLAQESARHCRYNLCVAGRHLRGATPDLGGIGPKPVALGNARSIGYL